MGIESSGLGRVRTQRMRGLVCVLALVVATAAGALAQVQNYTKLVIFGDSLSDTGNVADLTQGSCGVRIPSPNLLLGVDYADGSFTDSFYTAPPAQNFEGVWVEQLAHLMPHQPVVKDSLDGGTNYAYGFALNGNGTSPLSFGPTNLCPVQVHNIGQQITDYLATHPTIDRQTLFVIWGGANDVLSVTGGGQIFGAAFQQTLNMQRLIQAGATQFLVLNLPPLGLTPRLNGGFGTKLAGNAAAALYNSYLAAGVSTLESLYRFKRLKFYQLDVFRLMQGIVAHPGIYGLTDVKDEAIAMPVNPDTYLFWDDLHPTTKGHNLLAEAAYGLMTQ